MKIYSKESLIYALCAIRQKGFILNTRGKNDGAVGNLLEDLLGIAENNLPLPNAGEWELKAQRANRTSLLTLAHMEPSPTALKCVAQILLPNYGWAHKNAGKKYPKDEKSFRQTLRVGFTTDRGFTLNIIENKVAVSFNAAAIDEKHSAWKKAVENSIGLNELNPQPYWGFNDLFCKIGGKLHNTFYVEASVKKEKGKEFFHYQKILQLQHFSLNKMVEALQSGKIYVDFDARTHHNHGTKLRIARKNLPDLYEIVKEI